ncbi:hypothetical protein LY90DRAFT_14258 [Neocallimastix californiae]|uniref:Signal peptidase complex subunit 2 n=1 Tax=Neocallimastix californiae TaxID=1754190 RepID=A0A1Y2CH84_9FUNG|nr:hypothetical protein LY90DRAFT_14258 [Neocallimastix californiae]|eukprot:ORY46296.1 hypothetical protein LY90DRAFT_14258 [Neocallimastix californiae]
MCKNNNNHNNYNNNNKKKKKKKKKTKYITVSLKNQKYSDLVEITIKLKDSLRNSTKTLKKSYGNWFDEEGNFVASAFLKDIEYVLEKKQ